MTLAHRILSRIDPKWVDVVFDFISMCFDIFMNILSPCLIVLACGLIGYVCRLGFFVLLPLRAVRFFFFEPIDCKQNESHTTARTVHTLVVCVLDLWNLSLDQYSLQLFHVRNDESRHARDSGVREISG